MDEKAFLITLFVSLAVAQCFAAFFLFIFPVWMVRDCLGSRQQSAVSRVFGVLFIAVLWPLTPLLYGLMVSRRMFIRVVSVMMAVIIACGAGLCMLRWNELKALKPEWVRFAGAIKKEWDTGNSVRQIMAPGIKPRRWFVPSLTARRGSADSAMPALPARQPDMPAAQPLEPSNRLPLPLPLPLPPLPAELPIYQPVQPMMMSSAMTDEAVSSRESAVDTEVLGIPKVTKVGLGDTEVVRSFYPSGQINMEHTFRSGKLDGTSTNFYESGKPRYIRDYESGKLTRIQKFTQDGIIELDTDRKL